MRLSAKEPCVSASRLGGGLTLVAIQPELGRHRKCGCALDDQLNSCELNLCAGL